MLIYADNPFDATNPLCQDGNYPNGIADGEINGGLSHEHNESITDPLPNDAWTNGAGPNQGKRSAISASARWAPRWGRRPTAPSTTR